MILESCARLVSKYRVIQISDARYNNGRRMVHITSDWEHKQDGFSGIRRRRDGANSQSYGNRARDLPASLFMPWKKEISPLYPAVFVTNFARIHHRLAWILQSLLVRHNMANTTQSLQDLYESYKRNTKYVLGWLRSICPSNTHLHQQTRFKSTAEILKAAEQVRSQKFGVPRSVISALGEAIATRRRVLEVYQSLPSLSGGKDASDLKHRVFIRKYVSIVKLA